MGQHNVGQHNVGKHNVGKHNVGKHNVVKHNVGKHNGDEIYRLTEAFNSLSSSTMAFSSDQNTNSESSQVNNKHRTVRTPLNV